MEEELRTYQEKLEQMVEERTAELKKTQKELVNKARQAGALEKRNISVRQELDPNLSDLLIDKNRFMQVLVNLIKNGYEAIDELKADQQNTMTFRTFSHNGQIGLEISDSGIGIDPAFISQVFKFGKSSKGSTGFGLHYCQIFVEANNGTLNISSPGRGKGASITVEFAN